MGTYVRVINLGNNKHIVLRINDRGPFVKGRIIDLSYAAAKEIGLIGPGVAKVKVTALGKEIKPAGPSSNSQAVVEVTNLTVGDFSVQIGAFQDEKNANHLADRLRVIFEYVNVVKYADENNQVYYRVWVTKTGSLQEAGDMEKRLEDMGFVDAFVVRM
jgi:rare lipoprotein A